MSLILPLGYMAAIFILSAIPNTEDAGHRMLFVPPTIQNFLHIPAYGLLALLWIRTLKDHGYPENMSILAAILLSSAYGGLMEFYQAWVPGRFPSAMDFMFNVSGVLLFVWVYQQFKDGGIAKRRAHSATARQEQEVHRSW